jgi:hypothetical protein
MGARARTDLINFGGTMPLSPAAAAMESELAFAAGRTVDWFPAKLVEVGVFFAAGRAPELFEASGAEGSAPSFGSAGSVLGSVVLPDAVLADATGASATTFVLLISECACAALAFPGSGDDFSFAATTSEPTGPFFAAGFQGSQCLDHAAPATVTISADRNRPKRSAPPRKLGVKLPRARRSRLDFGSDLLKSSEGFGRSACSSAVHCVATALFPTGRNLSGETLADISGHRLLAVDTVPGTSPAPSVGVTCETSLGPSAGAC